MSKWEIELFTSFLVSSTSYFEFGMGGSTCLAAQIVKKNVYGVDSDLNWIAKVKGEIEHAAVTPTLIHVDIGPTGGWGTPLLKNSKLFDDYSLSITKTGIRDFDLCLVDGRFRVACFLQALKYLNTDSIIGIHDYRVRPHYHIVEEFARPICECQQLTFFARRPLVSERKLKAVQNSYRRIPD